MGWDLNPRTPCDVAGFQDRCIQPLCHPSVKADILVEGGNVVKLGESPLKLSIRKNPLPYPPIPP